MKKKWFITVSFWVMVALLAIPPVLAAEKEPLSLVMTGYLVVTEIENGKEVTKLKPLTDEVQTGDIIQYDVKGENSSDRTLNKIQTGGKIPEGTIYIDGSARCDTEADILFSIDSGKTFSMPPIKIKVKLADGTEVEKIVPPEQYTDIQFVVPSVKAGETFLGQYGVMVK